jgi:ribosomal protein L32
MTFSVLVRSAERLRLRFHQFLYRNVFPQNLQIAYAGNNLDMEPAHSNSSIFEDFIWLAGPKSKVCIVFIPLLIDNMILICNQLPSLQISPGRKREKHGRFYPERVGWKTCERCGESKMPHRICTKNAQLCAMREEDWQLQKKADAANAQKAQNV